MNLQTKLNYYGSLKEPFLFIIDFDLKNYDIILLKDLPNDIKYSMSSDNKVKQDNHQINKESIELAVYKRMFDKVQSNILDGNCYLLNLTTQTKIDTSLTLKEIFNKADAKFKLYYKDKFVCFSPERFVKIINNKIFTYPMKGTIDASIKDAKNNILNNPKELAEHTMVVDLLRNDLSIISKNVKVDKFRYIDKIKAGKKELLQVSSEISGELENDWHSHLGDILVSLLPAGSITGTPKRSATKLIKEIENMDRGYFTGVFGVYDCKTLDSAVMIRFIEKLDDGNLIYKSGGGITSDSDMEDEYNEMIDKVYIP